MEAFDLYIAHVYWGNEGKRRPVLILSQIDDKVSAFKITTQYDSKSEAVRHNLFAIDDWDKAGLTKQSYIDIGNIIKLPLSLLGEYPIGKLSNNDKIKLEKLLKERIGTNE